MKKPRFSDNQIVNTLKQSEQGAPVADLCLKARPKYGGMDAAFIGLLKNLEIKNAQLKKIYPDECLKSDILQDAMSKKW